MAYIPGNEFNNELFGTAGNDSIEALGGFDTLIGGAGNDTLNGGDGFDRIKHSGASFYTLTNARLTATEAGTVYVDTLISIESAELNGNNNGNTINAAGFTGNTLLKGNGGDDTMYGGYGTDIMFGGDGNDTVIGNDGTDQMFGGSGNDFIVGVRSGALDPGKGEKDELTGGGSNTTAGRDTFALGDATKVYYDDDTSGFGSSDYAIIRDFQVDQDIIRLKGGVQYSLDAISVDGVSGLGITAQINGNSELLGVMQTNNPSGVKSALQIANAPAGDVTIIKSAFA